MGNSFSTTSASAAAATSLTLAAMRQWVRQASREAADPNVYTDAQVDRAILSACSRFCRATRAVRTTSTLSLSEDSAALPTLPTGFRPEQALAAYLNDDDETTVKITDYDAVRRARRTYGSTGVPTLLAFTSATAGQVYPTPDDDYTLTLSWWRTFVDGAAWRIGANGAYSASVSYRIGDVVSVTSGGTTLYVCIQSPALAQAPASSAAYWTSLGTGTAASVDPAQITTNLPDDWLAEILPVGPPLVLQGTEGSQWWMTPAWKAVEDGFRGSGGSGAKSISRAQGS